MNLPMDSLNTIIASLSGVCNPIITKMYQPAGGVPGRMRGGVPEGGTHSGGAGGRTLGAVENGNQFFLDDLH
ncbi:hypothetical protein OSTOST_14324 [Ostertagia ostertagi]